MDETVGTKAVIWGSVGTELLNVVYDLRYMVLCAVALILADLWWGYSESRLRRQHAKEIGNATLEDKFKWHKVTGSVTWIIILAACAGLLLWQLRRRPP